MTVSARLAELGIDLPDAPTPAGAYIPAKVHADLVYTAGQLPLISGTLPETGKVGDGHGLVPASDAQAYARQSALNAIAAAAAAVGGVDRLTGVV
jgi:enamine deaminase RidA (YjgF/YER057c/UK114 family)